MSTTDEKQKLLRQLYQIIGSMLSDMGLFESERGQKLLDNIYAERVLHDDLLPWPALGDKIIDSTKAYLKGLHQGSKQERERIAQEFDRRAVYIGGTPHASIEGIAQRCAEEIRKRGEA